jgi:uncharacterized protein YycO
MKSILFVALIFCCALSSNAQRTINIYTDAEIIKLTNYIKKLEYRDSINTITIKKQEQELKDWKAKEEKNDKIIINKETTREGK